MRVFGTNLPLVVLIVALAGCNQKEEIQVYRVVKEGGGGSAPGVPADPHAGLSLGVSPGAELPPGHPTTPSDNSLTGDTPEDWKPGKPSSMRRASFLAKGAAGETADISLVILPGSAGGVLDNVNRWRGQLGQAALDAPGLERIVERLATRVGEAVVVDIEGLAAGADPAFDGRMVAAIVARPQETWFFKMRGNATLVGAQKQGFLDWVASLRPAERDRTPTADTVAGIDPTAGLPADHPPVPTGSSAAKDRDRLKWQLPAGWAESAPKPMRVATFALTGPGGEAGEVTVVKLSGDGGGSLANLNRWRRQIGMPPIEAGELAAMIGSLQAGGLEMSTVDLAGPDRSTVAAWVGHDGGSWFFKLTGPPAVVEAERENFAGFLKSIAFVVE